MMSQWLCDVACWQVFCDVTEKMQYTADSWLYITGLIWGLLWTQDFDQQDSIT